MLQIRVIGKGRRGRSVDYGIKTRKALRNYEKARSLHPLANLDWLWLGNRGKQLTQSGIAQLLRRRCRAAPPSFTRTCSATALLILGSPAVAKRATS